MRKRNTKHAQSVSESAGEDDSKAYKRIVEGSVWYEYYGFLLYLTSGAAFVAYLGWAFLPDEFLHSLGITYYPSKYWTLALPSLFCMLCFYLLALGFGYCLSKTPPLNSISYIVDSHSVVVSEPTFVSIETDSEIHDISMAVANQCLYPPPE